MTIARRLVVTGIVVAIAGQVASRPVSSQALGPERGVQTLAVMPATLADVRAWDGEVTRMSRDGTLRLLREREDTLVPRRQHERLAQYHDGLPVFGGEVTRQSEGGVPVSLLGTVYRGIDLETMPRISADAARQVMLGQPDAQGIIGDPELLVLPLDQGGYALAYRMATAFSQDILISFVDAQSGGVLMQYSDLQSQHAVGNGRGVLGDTKKVSAEQSGGTYRTSDRLRPPVIQTYDMRGNLARTNDVVAGRVTPGVADLGADADNDWTDAALVDGHVYAGWTYDYYLKQFGRRGLDNNNLAIRSLVNPVNRSDFTPAFFAQNSAFFTNAFWSPTLRLMVYGVGLPPGVTLNGQSWNFMSGSLDVVAHELTHGVTQFSSNLIYRGESGALNEAFSDIMAAGAEFFFAAERGRPGNYLAGDDVVTPGGIRSMANPAAYSDPDHYSQRFLDAADNFGVHSNSAIANHAFYLAIEGGSNRTSGLSVQGVGGANRQQIERIFYRAFTLMLPASGNHFQARVATIQSARDLYGAASAAERAVTQAWDAVGVQQQAAQIGFLYSANPVPPAPAGVCALTRPNFVFLVGAAENGGVGFTVSAAQIRFYDAANVLSSTQALNFPQLFNACGPGNSRIAPGGLPCAQLCVSLGGAASGSVDFVISGRDDLGNPGTFSSSRLRLGTATAGAPVTPVQGSFMPVAR